MDLDNQALIALGEQKPTGAERVHLDTCRSCAESLATTVAVVDLGRHSRPLSDLLPPPARVWRAIAAATVDLDPDPQSDEGTPESPAVRSAPVPRPGHHGAAPGSPVEPRSAGRSGARHAGRSGRMVVAGAVLAAALLGVGATLGVVALRHRPAAVAAGNVLARGALAPPVTGAAGAHGTAALVAVGAGHVLRLAVTGLPAPAGYYEVWLDDPTADRMIAIGALGATAELDLPVPPTVDTGAYRVVDISAQPLDGDPTHGRSVLRGTLS